MAACARDAVSLHVSKATGPPCQKQKYSKEPIKGLCGKLGAPFLCIASAEGYSGNASLTVASIGRRSTSPAGPVCKLKLFDNFAAQFPGLICGLKDNSKTFSNLWSAVPGEGGERYQWPHQ